MSIEEVVRKEGKKFRSSYYIGGKRYRSPFFNTPDEANKWKEERLLDVENGVVFEPKQRSIEVDPNRCYVSQEEYDRVFIFLSNYFVENELLKKKIGMIKERPPWITRDT